MALTTPGAGVLEACEREIPVALPGEILVRVRACGVCRTDVHIVDGELTPPELPIIPGHEIVGVVDAVGDSVAHLAVGDRVGIPWLAYSCGECEYCKSGRENLCREARFTGYQMDGGYAEYAVADARYAFKLPGQYSDAEAAPLLCAGMIGYRAYRMAGEGKRLGLYGFGAAAHLLAQVAIHHGRHVSAFTSPGDDAAQAIGRQPHTCGRAGVSGARAASEDRDARDHLRSGGREPRAGRSPRRQGGGRRGPDHQPRTLTH